MWCQWTRPCEESQVNGGCSRARACSATRIASVLVGAFCLVPSTFCVVPSASSTALLGTALPPHCCPLYRGLVFPMEARLIPCLLYESANDNESTTTINSDCSRSSLTIKLLLSLCYTLYYQSFFSFLYLSTLYYSLSLCTASSSLYLYYWDSNYTTHLLISSSSDLLISISRYYSYLYLYSSALSLL